MVVLMLMLMLDQRKGRHRSRMIRGWHDRWGCCAVGCACCLEAVACRQHHQEISNVLVTRDLHCNKHYHLLCCLRMLCLADMVT